MRVNGQEAHNDGHNWQASMGNTIQEVVQGGDCRIQPEMWQNLCKHKKNRLENGCSLPKPRLPFSRVISTDYRSADKKF